MGSRHPAVEPDEPVWLRIERAHQQIRSFFDREFGDAERLGRPQAFLETLPAVLVKHFAEEEEPEGLFDALRAERPAVDAQLKFLQREHREILRAVESLERQIREMEPIEQPARRKLRLARIQERMGALLQMIRRHEETETQMVADVYYTEEGGSG